jgi:hypothetical protein
MITFFWEIAIKKINHPIGELFLALTSIWHTLFYTNINASVKRKSFTYIEMSASGFSRG